MIVVSLAIPAGTEQPVVLSIVSSRVAALASRCDKSEQAENH